MKHRVLAAAVVLSVGLPMYAQQWTEPDTTSFTTTRKVAIGTSTAPTKQLEVIGEATFSSFLTAGEVLIKPSSGVTRSRLQMYGSSWLGMTLNAHLGTQWDLDDTTVAGWIAKLDGRAGWDQFAIMRIPPGANPHTDEKVLFQVHGNGNVGIGLGIGTSPTTTLHVKRDADDRANIMVENAVSGATANAGYRANAAGTSFQIFAQSSGRTGVVRWGPASMAGWSEFDLNTGNGLAIGTLAAAPLLLGTNSQSRMYFTGDGNIGINTITPQDGVHLYNKNLMLQASDQGGPSGITYITLAAKGENNGNYMYRLATAGSQGAYGVVPNALEMYEYGDLPNDPTGCCKLRMQVRPAKGVTGPKPLIIDGTGNVGIGTWAPAAALDVTGSARVRGDVVVDGNIGAKYQDVAEWVPASEEMAPGMVVVLNPKSINEVMPSARAYDTRVAGVVSAQPGIILGEAGAKKEQIATTGRVKVRVDATKGPIEVGDLLVTSDVAGTAMKSQPIDLGGVAIHRPGTIVGKALEPLATGTGEILVLLSLQ